MIDETNIIVLLENNIAFVLLSDYYYVPSKCQLAVSRCCLAQVWRIDFKRSKISHFYIIFCLLDLDLNTSTPKHKNEITKMLNKFFYLYN